MFKAKEKIEQLERKYTIIHDLFHALEEKVRQLPDENDKKFEKINGYIDKKLLEFRKEMADKYFESMNNFIRWNKEMVLVQSLTNNSGSFAQLKKEMIKPFLDERFKENNALKSQEINRVLTTKGEEIRKLRETTHQEYLVADREDKDFEKIARLKGKLDALDSIIGMEE